MKLKPIQKRLRSKRFKQPTPAEEEALTHIETLQRRAELLIRGAAIMLTPGPDYYLGDLHVVIVALQEAEALILDAATWKPNVLR